jgi:transcriptional regulator with XRE-family HTH domain
MGMEALYPWCALLKKEREDRLWSQEDLAGKIGSNERTVRGWELGESIPGKYFRRELCDLYQKKPEELCLDEETIRTAKLAQSVSSESVILHESSNESVVEDNQYTPVVITEVESVDTTALQPAKRQDQRKRFGDPFPEIWNVPRGPKAFFTGRDRTLQQLSEGFSPNNDASVTYPYVLDGLGGIGKTQTATEYAFRYRHNYQAVLWVKASTKDELLADYQTIAGLLNIPEKHAQISASLEQVMKEWFITHTEWLLILDNVEDIAQIERFLPKPSRGHILLTMRSQSSSGIAQAIQLEPLSPEDGALCVLRRAGLVPWTGSLGDTTQERVAAAQNLSQLMKGLPLALEQAGAYIEDTRCGIFRYLDLYKQELYRYRLQSIQSGSVPDYPTTVASAWSMSRKAVQSNHPIAASILKLCAFLGADAIPLQIVTRGVALLASSRRLAPERFSKDGTLDPINFDQSLKILLQYSLLNRDMDRDIVSMHRIMQEVQQAEMDAEEQKTLAECVVRAVVLTRPYVERQILQPHIKVCQEHIKRWQMTFPEAEQLWREEEEYREEE